MPAINYGADYYQRQNQLLSGGGGGTTQLQPLPASGIMRQASTMQSFLAGSQQPNMTDMQGPAAPQQTPNALQPRPGTSNLNDIAQTLAQSYGLPLGRGPLVDQQGNFMRMPTNADEATKFQFISQAIADEQNRRESQRAVSSLQAGIGLVQNRGRGSLATMMSGQYGQLAEVYQNQQHVAQDFSYFVQKEQLEKAERIAAQMRKSAKKSGIAGIIGGVIGGVIGTFVAPGVGTAAGYAIGSGVGSGAAAGGLF